MAVESIKLRDAEIFKELSDDVLEELARSCTTMELLGSVGHSPNP